MNKYVNYNPLSFLCFGSGAIGTYVGGSLSLAGNKVVFLDKPVVADQLKSSGLILQIEGMERRVSEPVVSTTMEEALSHGPFDVAIVAVKSYDTRSLLEKILSYKELLPPLLCLQNGVENEDILASAVGIENIIPGSVTSAVGKKPTGGVILERLRGIGISSSHQYVPALISTLNAAGLNARFYSDARSMKWSKMITNLLANATCAIMDMTPREIMADKRLYRLEIAQLQETLYVMSAMHLRVVNLPGTPVRLLSWAIRFIPSLSQPILIRAIGSGRGRKMPSFHIDLYSNTGRSEVDYLNGAVVRFGKAYHIPTPVNDLLNNTLTRMVQGEIRKEEFAHQPERLISLMNTRKS